MTRFVWTIQFIHSFDLDNALLFNPLITGPLHLILTYPEHRDTDHVTQ